MTHMKFNSIRTVCMATAIALAPAALFAQTDPMSPGASQTSPNLPQQQQAASTSMQDSTGAMGNTGQTMRDKMFLRKATEGDMAEIQLGKLASEKAESPEVKAFGQKMVTDHTALSEQMKPIALGMGVPPPKKLSKKDQAEFDKLSSLSGADFDNEYIAYMAKDHHKDLRDFRDEAQTAGDPVLKDAAAKGQKVIQEHTAMVDKLAKDKGIATVSRKED
ncbi:DUF4142 domain-containing protein [Granulicella sp. dw_53]|uniref:DUF4142 domain-containing protein n=1 Tax=Granulicella sp. dw_53 TaxID=2719792 RepID=UPI001BD50CA5|nr:DUF4142 domain-containing protein [Granulicella sp. dw_53]